MRRLPKQLPIAALAMAGVSAVASAQAARLEVIAGDTVVALAEGVRRGRATGADPRVMHLLRWRTVRPGLEEATLDLRAGTLRAPVQATVVRLHPARFRFALQHAVRENGMTGTWAIDSAGPAAALAMNAGQFKETGPWGWLVMEGEELRSPGRAPLGIGIRIDTVGRLRWVPPGAEARFRHDRATRYAFQSFPLLFHDRRVPALLRDADAMRLGHRDARLVLAEQDDGRIMVLLTRYGGLGAVGQRVPIGLTTPETIALASALGARHAVMLDGGVSAQLLLRDGQGGEVRRPGLRRVPLGIVAVPRDQD